ncbi:MAG: 4-hydroxy-tetrahydrodipicolinate reductase [Oscillospiraceae bacterium]|jgi:4-hydroxy-tetrahydrodipicolinate reductase|nr:4-hydroxy-tetrahydrodipicolinate reductase [Oscillospiraceae bacterium]
MLNILLSGCTGQMGRVVAALAAQHKDTQILAGIDPGGDSSLSKFPVFASPADFSGKADIIIDFSHPNALAGLLEYAVSHRTPAVICTTGLVDAQVNLVRRAADRIPVFFSANMSLGVNLLKVLAQRAAQILGATFDIEIVEAHHNQKVDAPSGTALMLADAIHEILPDTHYVYDRSQVRRKRDKKEIGISAIRGGTIVGEHEVIFAGHSEVLKLSHSAQSKELFAAGALNAAAFLRAQQPGLYDMRDMISI